MTQVTINDIVIEGATRRDSNAGWNAPTETVERGFEFSTYVSSEPIAVTLEAWVEPDVVEQLTTIREAGEPFSASIGDLGIPEAKLDDLSVSDEATRLSHHKVTLKIEEITFAEMETAEVSFEAPGGSMSSSASANPPSVAGSEPTDDDPSGTSDSGGIIESLSNAADSMASALGF